MSNKCAALGRVARMVPFLVAMTLWVQPKTAFAGPPFLTDDPLPIDYKHWELYTFSTRDKSGAGTSTVGPAIEYNVGPLPNVHVHFVVPFAWNAPVGGPTASGLGDTEFGIKFRFVQETQTRPQIGVFPMAELPTGNPSDGIGNGRIWFRLPLWIQKSWGPWTTYGGGGEAINTAPGMLTYGFGGGLIQRDFGPLLTLGTEIFTTGATTVGQQGATYYTVGGYIKPTDRFNILFDIGHTFSGQNHAVSYFGLYWTGGPKEP
jgi:hypothetical protein